jgi:hypothetical protein
MNVDQSPGGLQTSRGLFFASKFPLRMTRPTGASLWLNRPASRYVPTNQESVSPEASGWVKTSRDDRRCGRPVRNLPSRLRGAEFYRRQGGFSRASGRRYPLSPTASPHRASKALREPHTGAERGEPSGFRPLARPSRRAARIHSRTTRGGTPEQFFEAVNCQSFLQDSESVHHCSCTHFD